MNPITISAPTLSYAKPLDFIDAAAAAGFDGVGLRLSKASSPDLPFHPVVGNAPLIADIKRRLADTGLKFLDIYTFYLTPSFDLDACKAALEVGAEFGAKFAATVGYDADHARARDTFARICDAAQQFGLTTTIEFAPLDNCWPATLDQAVGLLREVDRPNAAIMPDPKHLLATGGAIADLRAVDPRYIRYCQICDVEIQGDVFLPALGRNGRNAKRRLLGEGILNVAEWLDVLPPGISISVECVPQPKGLADREWAMQVGRTTRQAIESCYRDQPGNRRS
ncbi:MAG: TIM barrel protein [Pseudomonadota bacterium]